MHIHTCRAQFVSLCDLQNGLGNFASIRLGFESGLGTGLGQKFAICACAISELRSTFCKLHRLTNRTQHIIVYIIVIIII